jgi:hypothetical protein
MSTITYTYPGAKRKLAPLTAENKEVEDLIVSDLKDNGAIDIEVSD